MCLKAVKQSFFLSPEGLESMNVAKELVIFQNKILTFLVQSLVNKHSIPQEAIAVVVNTVQSLWLDSKQSCLLSALLLAMATDGLSPPLFPGSTAILCYCGTYLWERGLFETRSYIQWFSIERPLAILEDIFGCHNSVGREWEVELQVMRRWRPRVRLRILQCTDQAP